MTKRLRRRWLATGLVTAVVAAGVVTMVSAGPAQAVIGGSVTPVAAYPYYVYLQDASRNCGGTLITATWVLTAAHCVDGDAANGVTLQLSNLGPPVTSTYVAVHPLWDGDGGDGHDLAVVEVPASATAGIPRIQTGSPFDSTPYLPGTGATIMGRGVDFPGDPQDFQFRTAHTEIRSDDEMEAIFDPFFEFSNWIPSLMIGAGQTTVTDCYGDSGSPLVTTGSAGQSVLVGVASMALDDCSSADAFSKLNGPDLAWVALWAGGIVSTWGPCTLASGGTGTGTAFYASDPPAGFWQQSGTDDGYYWAIGCVGPPPPPPTGTPKPTKTSTSPPPPPGCTGSNVASGVSPDLRKCP
jgi:hypothetical protein